MFADDLNVFKRFPARTDNDEVVSNIMPTREHVHRCGKRNRVSFDPIKEDIAVLHPTEGTGQIFPLLGCYVDPKLNMEYEIDQLINDNTMEQDVAILKSLPVEGDGTLRTRKYKKEIAPAKLAIYTKYDPPQKVDKQQPAGGDLDPPVKEFLAKRLAE